MTPDDEDEHKPTKDLEAERERRQMAERWERYQKILTRDARKQRLKRLEKQHG